MAIDTSSTQGQFDALRARILTFAPASGSTLDTLLKQYRDDRTGAIRTEAVARLYVNDPDDGAKYPHVVLRVLPRSGDAGHHGLREEFELEATCIHRPRSLFWELQEIADTLDECFRLWADASDPAGGFLGSKSRIRQTVPRPPAGSPADREVIQELIRYQIISWPRFLNQYAD